MKKHFVSSVILGGLFSQLFFTAIYAQENLPLETIIESDIIGSQNMQGISDSEEFMQISRSVDLSNKDQKSLNNVKKTALKYIEGLEPYDKNWIGKSPKLLGNPIPYYTDDENSPLVYEWKIACQNTRDCGSILIATLDGVSHVMEASTYGTTNYERLGKGKLDKQNKFYYYSPFDQYIESRNLINQNGISILSDDVSIEVLDPGKQFKTSASEKKTELLEKKNQAKKMRKSGFAFTSYGVVANSNFAPLAVTTVDVPGVAFTSVCNAVLPCYDQFTSTGYAGSIGVHCSSGCSPTAMAIIFGYYDRKGTFPNLIGNAGIIASDTSVDIAMVNSIRSYMGTYCTPEKTGATPQNNINNGMQYARNRGYTNSTNGLYVAATATRRSDIIKSEINVGRPLIVNYTNGSTIGHTMAAYGYRTNSAGIVSEVHVNFGWGGFLKGAPDKYLPTTSPISSSNFPGINPLLIGTTLVSINTVPIK